ncbi:MAG: N-acetylmuramoyl-L-alanine amidase [Deferribacteres bacterium]|nr:N-acetylmuramoyl-L-alanine amidase [candidate division KSB1 bacterium]MCB9504008.1 N-acetylmuramoyl-L-alanine amidase [Deferribacteres bacterium]
MKKLLILIIFPLLTSCASPMKIIDSPISFSPERHELTLEYIQNHYNLTVEDITITPKIIVLHWTAIPTFEKTFSVFNREKLQGARPDLQGAGQVNVAIQFVVDRDGTIYRLMPETWMARHCIGINYNSIGVENVGGQNGKDDLTDAQIRANIQLVNYLLKKYPSIDYLIGHFEYQFFEGHPLWREMDDLYRTEKIDPGERFMKAVREAVGRGKVKGVKEIQQEIADYKAK